MLTQIFQIIVPIVIMEIIAQLQIYVMIVMLMNIITRQILHIYLLNSPLIVRSVVLKIAGFHQHLIMIPNTSLLTLENIEKLGMPVLIAI